MYNKLIKKKTLYKLFILIMPKKKKSTISCYYLCKYFINNTPYGKISVFLSEIKKFFNTFIFNYKKTKLIFACSQKIFFLNKTNKIKRSLALLNNKNLPEQLCFVFLYDMYYTSKLISFLKNKKLFLIGFINFHNQSNLTDFTILLESRFFSSIYFFHFLLKKFIYHVKQ